MKLERPHLQQADFTGIPNTDELVAVPVDRLPPNVRQRLSLKVTALKVRGKWFHSVWDRKRGLTGQMPGGDAVWWCWRCSWS